MNPNATDGVLRVPPDPPAASYVASTEDFISELFYRVDAALADVPRHPQGKLWPGEVVTLAILYALKGRGERAFYRWADRDLRPLFPALPDRTRLFRLFAAHRDWCLRFLAGATFFGVADSFGVETLNTLRCGRSRRRQIGRRRGKCARRRWMAGVKLGLARRQRPRAGVRVGRGRGLRVRRRRVRAPGRPLPRRDAMIVPADGNFHKSPFHRRRDYATDPDPPNLKLCPRGRWGERKLVETVLSMFDRVLGLKRVTERCWANLMAHPGAAVAAFNVLVGWNPDAPQLAIARFSM